MKTVKEVSELAGVSIRTLQYYDQIGLLCPAKRSDAGYRLYDDENMGKLQQILLFRELEFPLKEIKHIIESPDYDQALALEQQIELLKLKRKRINTLIAHATQLREKGAETMNFKAFDTSKLEAYKEQAKEQWGTTPEWQEYEGKSAGRSAQEEGGLANELLELFIPFGEMATDGTDPHSEQARAQAALIQSFISEHYYRCSDDVFRQLGQAYGSGGEFTQNINAIAGNGAAKYASRAIEAYTS